MTVTPFNGTEPGRVHHVTGGGDGSNKFSPTVIESPPHSGDYRLLYRSGGTIYSQAINKTLETGQEATVATPTAIGASYINGFDVVWDGDNNEWLFFASEGSSKPCDGYLFAVSESDNSWTVTSSSQIMSDHLHDGGPSIMRGNGTNVFLGGVNYSTGSIELWEITDMTSRPLPSSADNGPQTWLKREYDFARPVNIQLFQVQAETLGCMFECASSAGWNTKIAYGMMPATNGITREGNFKGPIYPAGVVSDYTPVAANHYNNDANFTHGQFTTVLGRPLIFGQYLSAKGVDLDYGIYAYEVDSQRLMNPADNFPFRARVLDDESGPAQYIPTFGARQVRIHRQQSTDGTLTLWEFIRATAKPSQSSRDSATITESHARVAFDDPQRYIAVEDSTSSRVTLELVK